MDRREVVAVWSSWWVQFNDSASTVQWAYRFSEYSTVVSRACPTPHIRISYFLRVYAIIFLHGIPNLQSCGSMAVKWHLTCLLEYDFRTLQIEVHRGFHQVAMRKLDLLWRIYSVNGMSKVLILEMRSRAVISQSLWLGNARQFNCIGQNRDLTVFCDEATSMIPLKIYTVLVIQCLDFCLKRNSL